MMFFNKAKNYLIITGFFFLSSAGYSFAQNNEEQKVNTFLESNTLISPPDSTMHFVESLFDYLDIASLYLNLDAPTEDFGLNPYFLPVVFDGKYSDDLTIRLPELPGENKRPFFVPDTIYTQSEGKRYVDRLRRKAYRHLISQRIDLVKYKLSDFPEEVEKIVELKPNPFFDIFKKDFEPVTDKVEVAGKFKPKKIYWIKNGSSLIQFSQNYISDNWYKGGTGNLNLLSVQNYTANYKRNKVQFNNFVEWKLSFYTNPNDTLRSFRIGDDLLRYYGDLGVRAFRDQWFYSSNVEIKTQLFNNYKENSTEIISGFLAPVIVNVGILGMKYQTEKKFPKNKYKKVNISADISPLSIQCTYVGNKEVDETRFGIEKDRKHLIDFGSTINAKLIVNFNREISFSSRFKLFSNYKKTIIESENELNFSLNRFFSTRLYFYPRFDDSPGLTKDDKYGFTQISEVLSFGFNFKW